MADDLTRVNTVRPELANRVHYRRFAMAKIIVHGAGLAGMSAAYELRERLGKTHSVTVVGDGDRFSFTPSNPWLAVGWREADDFTFPAGEYLAKYAFMGAMPLLGWLAAAQRGRQAGAVLRPRASSAGRHRCGTRRFIQNPSRNHWYCRLLPRRPACHSGAVPPPARQHPAANAAAASPSISLNIHPSFGDQE